MKLQHRYFAKLAEVSNHLGVKNEKDKSTEGRDYSLLLASIANLYRWIVIIIIDMIYISITYNVIRMIFYTLVP